MRIYRYELDVTDTQDVPMPAGATLLHVEALGHRQIELWAAVDPQALTRTRVIAIVGTGHDFTTFLPIENHYLGTVIAFPGMGAARAVWHVFDGGEH